MQNELKKHLYGPGEGRDYICPICKTVCGYKSDWASSYFVFLCEKCQVWWPSSFGFFPDKCEAEAKRLLDRIRLHRASE
jgi:hypothetical protein